MAGRGLVWGEQCVFKPLSFQNPLDSILVCPHKADTDTIMAYSSPWKPQSLESWFLPGGNKMYQALQQGVMWLMCNITWPLLSLVIWPGFPLISVLMGIPSYIIQSSFPLGFLYPVLNFWLPCLLWSLNFGLNLIFSGALSWLPL